MTIKSTLFVAYTLALVLLVQTGAYASQLNGRSLVVQADEKCPCKCGKAKCDCPHCPKK